MVEIWKDIRGHEGSYQVSNNGRVKSLARITYVKNRAGLTYKRKEKGTILKINHCKNNNSVTVVLSKNSKHGPRIVSRLVGVAFIDNELQLPNILHLDLNPANNNVNNLKWCTHSESIRHVTRDRHDRVVYKKLNDNINNRFNHIVMCVQTSELFKNMTAAAAKYNRSRERMRQVINTRTRISGLNFIHYKNKKEMHHG